MSLYSIPNIIGALVVIFIGLVVFLKNKRAGINVSLFFLCLLIFLWLLSYAIAFSTQSRDLAYFFCRMAGTSAMMTTACLYTFYAYFMNKFDREKKYIILSFAAMGVMIPGFIFTNLFLETPYKYPWGYYSRAGVLHPYYLIVFFAIWFKGLAMFLDKDLWTMEDVSERNRNKYILVMYLIIILGLVDYLPKYGIDIYPLGWVALVAFAGLFAYGIVKYRFLDISLAITRTTIFVAVYSIVLGIPFALAFGCQKQLIAILGDTWWIIPLITSTILATAGPFIFLFIQKKAEDKLLQEQRQYQATLRRASLGMGRVKGLNKLLNLIVHVVTRTVKIENCEMYLLHEDSGQYVLKSSKRNKDDRSLIHTIKSSSEFIQYLNINKEPIIFDEIKQKSQEFKSEGLFSIVKIMSDLNANLAVPSFIEQRLIAIIVLGRKRSGKLYSRDDLVVFSILANQSALAIENAQFYEDMKKTHEQLFKAEKMATIGTMADGLSHQINNRLHALGFVAGDILDTVRLTRKKKALPQDIEQIFSEIEHGLERIQDNVKRGGEIVEGLLKYTRKGEEGFAAVSLDRLITASLEMAQFKIKLSEINIVRNYNQSTPAIHGNFTQLQEVFFNIIDNAYDAVVQRKQDLKEPGFVGELKISVVTRGKNMDIFLRDNGIGVKQEDVHKLFTPFFTTKLSSKKGTGLGLYVIRQLIEENHGGKVVFTSEFKNGSQTVITLPIAQDKEKNNTEE